jgi:hypothetical protein
LRTAAGLDGEAEVEHESDRGRVAVLGCTHDRCALVVGQSGDQGGIVGELPLRLGGVGLEAGREELVGGCLVVCAVAAQQFEQIGSACGGRESGGRASVGSGGVRVCAVVEE